MTMRFLVLWLWLGALAPSAVAQEEAPGCVPGAQVSCACAGRHKGVQVCAADGHRYEACDCAPAGTAEPLVANVEPRSSDQPNGAQLVGGEDSDAYQSGRGMLIAGIVLVSVGVAAVAAGWVVCGVRVLNDEECVDVETGHVAHVALWAVGGATMIAGIPLLAVGAKRMRAARAGEAVIELSPFGLGVRF